MPEGKTGGITDPRLQKLYDYWASKHSGERLPARADIDPLDMVYVMGDIMLADVIEGAPPRFRIRLHGTNLSRRAGYDVTGKMLDELPHNQFRQIVRETWSKVVATGEPWHKLRDAIIDGKQTRYETLVLPLAADGKRVDMLMAAVIYDDRRA